MSSEGDRADLAIGTREISRMLSTAPSAVIDNLGNSSRLVGMGGIFDRGDRADVQLAFEQQPVQLGGHAVNQIETAPAGSLLQAIVKGIAV